MSKEAKEHGGCTTRCKLQGALAQQKPFVSVDVLSLCCSCGRLLFQRGEMRSLPLSAASSASAFRKGINKCLCLCLF